MNPEDSVALTLNPLGRLARGGIAPLMIPDNSIRQPYSKRMIGRHLSHSQSYDDDDVEIHLLHTRWNEKDNNTTY